MNANDIDAKMSINPVNEIFAEHATDREKQNESFVERQNKQLDLEIAMIQKLRKEMSPEENHNVTDKQLLDLVENSIADDDMLIY